MPCDHVARMAYNHGCPACADHYRSAALSARPAVPLTDLERAWFTDDRPVLRPEVHPRPTPTIVEHVGMGVMVLIGGGCAMFVVGIAILGLVNLLGGWPS